jgi:CII-binding regulator of phage lambda lysogenization HflD
MSTQLELGDDEDDLRDGLVTLVLTLVEIIDEALEEEAVRRMESGQLSDEEIENLGTQLKKLNKEIGDLKQREGVEDNVSDLKGDLDSLVNDAVEQLRRSDQINDE